MEAIFFTLVALGCDEHKWEKSDDELWEDFNKLTK